LLTEADRLKGTNNETRQIVLQNLEQVCTKIQKSLEVLTDIRVRELITDEEFTNQRNKLQAERDEIQKRIKKKISTDEKWGESVKNIFISAHHAKMWFKEGGLITQKKIAEYLGSNWSLKDKRISVALQKPFLLIEETLNGIRSENPRLEPSEYAGLESPFVDIEILNPYLCGLVTDVRTAVLESEHDYTLNIPEFLEKE